MSAPPSPTDSVKPRKCRGCGKMITTVDDMWVDLDEDCIVCSSCHADAVKRYPTSWNAFILPQEWGLDRLDEIDE